MSKILTLVEMMEACKQCGHPKVVEMAEAVALSVADVLARTLSQHYSMTYIGPSISIEPEGGVAASFHPRWEGQKWPEPLKFYDPDGDFE